MLSLNKLDNYIAHYNSELDNIQTVEEHLINTSNLAREFASKIGCETIGEMVGLLHDLGKFTDLFNRYIQSATGLIKENEEGYIDSEKYKGKIDHSTAGAIYLMTGKNFNKPELSYLISSLVIKSHHGGLRDIISPQGEDIISAYLNKEESETRFQEAKRNFEKNSNLKERVDLFFDSQPEIELQSIVAKVKKINKAVIKRYGQNSKANVINYFQMGLFIKYIYSCLIDADRMDTADFEDIDRIKIRQKRKVVDWNYLSTKLENHLSNFNSDSEINTIRSEISNACIKACKKNRGIYRLQVPTGGGKTLPSLRFAINHAKEHNLERIIYVIPYTSIIDQNADVYRQIFEKQENGQWSSDYILEHHSNLTNDKSSEETQMLAENWDAPIVLTTMVQFLESVFSGGTMGIRRMHRMAKSVIVFDEVQSLPSKTMVMYNQLINFLVHIANSSVVLCTATQPLLDNLPEDIKQYSLCIDDSKNIITNTTNLFQSLKRVQIHHLTKPLAWEVEEIGQLVKTTNETEGSVLVITNTKASALNLYQELKESEGYYCYHLSTNMCPVHRRKVFKEIRQKLDNVQERSKVICISTQLIEAGVDIDFDSVIRYIAGMDSIVQAAGRCNRHKRNKSLGKVFIIEPKEENVDRLPQIKKGITVTNRILNEFKSNPERFNNDLLGIKAMNKYYKYYYEEIEDMLYKVKNVQGIKRGDSLFNLYSQNLKSVKEYERINGKSRWLINQSFETAGNNFNVIEGGQVGVIVPFDKGKDIINELCSLTMDLKKKGKLLKDAQMYSINIHYNRLGQLTENGVIFEIKDEGIYYLNEDYYDDEAVGFVTEGKHKAQIL